MSVKDNSVSIRLQNFRHLLVANPPKQILIFTLEIQIAYVENLRRLFKEIIINHNPRIGLEKKALVRSFLGKL
jgi:hypothetical protein